MNPGRKIRNKVYYDTISFGLIEEAFLDKKLFHACISRIYGSVRWGSIYDFFLSFKIRSMFE